MPIPAAKPDRTVHCSRCEAVCCRMPVLVMPDDDPPPHHVTHDDHGLEVMAKLADGWCSALDRNTMRCTIYERRPRICRDFEMGGADCVAERAAWFGPARAPR